MGSAHLYICVDYLDWLLDVLGNALLFGRVLLVSAGRDSRAPLFRVGLWLLFLRRTCTSTLGLR